MALFGVFGKGLYFMKKFFSCPYPQNIFTTYGLKR